MARNDLRVGRVKEAKITKKNVYEKSKYGIYGSALGPRVLSAFSNCFNGNGLGVTIANAEPGNDGRMTGQLDMLRSRKEFK